jgi:hypothetical protein
MSIPSLRTTQPLYTMHKRRLFTRSKAAGACSWPLAISSAEVKNYKSTPLFFHEPLWRDAQLVKARDKFTFYLYLSQESIWTVKVHSFIHSLVHISCCFLWSIKHPWNASFHFSFVIFCIDDRTPWMRDQPVARTPPTHTGQHKHRIGANIHASIGIQPTTPVFERSKKVHAFDRVPLWSATVTVKQCFLTDYSPQLPTTEAALLRHELSSPAKTLGSWVRIPLQARVSMCIYSVRVVLCV